jgi:hypothetical protein
VSNFTCQQCGTDIIDSPNGYVTGCEHWPIEGASREVTRFNMYESTYDEWKTKVSDHKTVPVDFAIDIIWRAAMTCATNLVIQRQDRVNDRDGPQEIMDEQGEIAVKLKGLLECDEGYRAELKAMLAAAPATEPGEVERLRAKVAELEKQSDGVAEIAESMARKAEAAEAKLAAIGGLVEGLPRYSWSVNGMVTAYYDPRYVRFDQIQSLLNQTAPTANKG